MVGRRQAGADSKGVRPPGPPGRTSWRGCEQASIAGRDLASALRWCRQDSRRAPLLAASQARRDGIGAALPAQRARCRREARRSVTMRRNLTLLVLATTSTMVIGFLVPLGILIRQMAIDRAIAAADQDA